MVLVLLIGLGRRVGLTVLASAVHQVEHQFKLLTELLLEFEPLIDLLPY